MLRYATPAHFNVKTSGFCRTILLHKSNIQNPRFALFGLYLKYVNFDNLSALILTYFTPEKVRYFGADMPGAIAAKLPVPFHKSRKGNKIKERAKAVNLRAANSTTPPYSFFPLRLL